MGQMRALLSTVTGGPERLEIGTVPMPEPGQGEIRIRVAACGINFPDALIIEDRYQFKPERPFSPGTEVSGIVDAVGPGAQLFKVGDRVIGSGIFGGLAEYVVLKESRCFLLPEDLDIAEGAALLMTYGTAYHALKDRGNIAPGEKMLVLGAAGGVGLAAVQLGAALGAHVIGAVSSEEKAQAVRAAGAHEVILYHRELDTTSAKALTETIRSAADGTVDIVLDPVGGPYAEAALRTLGWGGRFLVVGFPAGIPRVAFNLPLLKSCSITGVFFGLYVDLFPEKHRADVAELIALWRADRIRPVISDRFPFEEGGKAIENLTSRKVVGKTVVMIDP